MVRLIFLKENERDLPAARYDVLLPSEVGYTLPNENLNSDTHRGMEGVLTYKSSVGQVDYTLSANATLSRRRDLDFYKPRFGNSYNEYRDSYVDRWGNINWGYQVEGQFQSQEEIESHTIDNDGQGNRTQLPGDFIYKDVNGDGIINGPGRAPDRVRRRSESVPELCIERKCCVQRLLDVFRFCRCIAAKLPAQLGVENPLPEQWYFAAFHAGRPLAPRRSV